MLNTEQTAHTRICAHKGTPSNAGNMVTNAPMAKQVMKKSPEETSNIRQTSMTTVHTSHKLDAKYSIIVFIRFIFSCSKLGKIIETTKYLMAFNANRRKERTSENLSCLAGTRP